MFDGFFDFGLLDQLSQFFVSEVDYVIEDFFVDFFADVLTEREVDSLAVLFVKVGAFHEDDNGVVFVGFSDQVQSEIDD